MHWVILLEQSMAIRDSLATARVIRVVKFTISGEAVNLYFFGFFSVNPCTIFNDPCRPCLSYLQIYSCLHLSVYECICIKIYTKFAKLGHKNVICDRIRLRLHICLR